MIWDIILLFKGFCSGFFYTFISIPSMVLVSHYIIQGNAKRGFVAALGTIFIQVIWSTIGLLVLLGSYTQVHSNSNSYAIIGSIILFIMAVRIYRSRENYNQQDKLSTNLFAIFGYGCLASLIFPIRILGYMGIFSAQGITRHNLSYLQAIVPVFGVFLGAFLWWIIFTLCIHKTKKMISPKTLHKFHKFSAYILIIFSFMGLLQLYV